MYTLRVPIVPFAHSGVTYTHVRVRVSYDANTRRPLAKFLAVRFTPGKEGEANEDYFVAATAPRLQMALDARWARANSKRLGALARSVFDALERRSGQHWDWLVEFVTHHCHTTIPDARKAS